MNTIQPYPISFSRLKQFKRSPKHLIHYLTEEKDPTPAMKFGSAFHQYVLQPLEFPKNYVTAPAIDKRTKAGKELHEEFAAANADKTIISTDDLDKIKLMADSLMGNFGAGELIVNAEAFELDTRWTDPDYNVDMRGIIDGIGTGYIFDIKTCPTASPDDFVRYAYSMGIHIQAAIYMDSEAAKTYGVKEYFIIAIEKDAPFGVSAFKLTDDLINKGRMEYKLMVNEFQQWVEMGMPNNSYDYWNTDHYLPLDAPRWAKTTEVI